MPAARPSGGRRVLRGVGRGLWLLLRVVVVLVFVALVAIHTDWGREQIRGVVESTMQGKFVGKVRVGRLEGSVFSELVLRDVQIDDEQGRPAIRIDSLTAVLGLTDLLSKQVRLEQLTARGVAIVARQDEQGLDLARLYIPDPEPLTFDVLIDHFNIEEAEVELHTKDGGVHHLDVLTIGGTLDLRAAGPIATNVTVAATYRERGAPITVVADLRTDTDLVRVPAARIAVDEVVVTVTDLSLQGRALAGSVSVVAPEAAVKRLVPDLGLRGDVALDATLTPQPSPAVGAAPIGITTAALRGSYGSASLVGTATVDLDAMHLDADVVAKGLDARLASPTAAKSDVEAHIVVSATYDQARSGFGAIDGKVAVTAHGTYERFELEALQLDASITDGRAEVAVVARAPGETHATLDAKVTLLDLGAIEIERAQLVARSADVGRASTGLVEAKGSVTVDLVASGRVDGSATSLAVKGTVLGKQLRYGTTSARDAKIQIDARGLPAAPVGTASVAVTGLRSGTLFAGALYVDARSRPDRTIEVFARSRPPLARTGIDARALVAIAGERIDVALGNYHVWARGVHARGTGGKIVLEPDRVVVRGVRPRVVDGTLAVDATYFRTGARAGGVQGNVALESLDLAQIDRALDLGGRLAGRANLTADAVMSPGGSVRGSVVGTIRGFTVQEGATPIDVDANASLAPGKVVVALTAKGEGLGAVDVELDVVAPQRLQDAARWMRLDRSAIRSGVLRVTALDLAAVARTVGLERELTGQVDGSMTLTPAGSTGTITVRDVDGLGLPGKLDADIGLDTVVPVRTGALTLTVNVKATVAGTGTAVVDLGVELPRRPFDMDAWKALDVKAVRGARVQVAGVVLDSQLLRRVGVLEPWRGRVALDLQVEPALVGMTAELTVAELSGGPLKTPVGARLRLQFDDKDGLRAVLTAALNEPGQAPQRLLVANAQVPVTRAMLRDTDAMLALPVTASVTLDEVPARAIATAFGRKGRLSGTVSVDAEATGPVRAPVGKATIVIAGLGTRRALIEELRADLAFDGKTRVATAKVRSNQRDGGTLALDGTVELDQLARARVSLGAKAFDLAPLMRLVPGDLLLGVAGKLDADVQAVGLDPATARISGDVLLHDAEVPIHPLVGTLRDAELTVSLHGQSLTVAASGSVGRGTAKLAGRAQLAGFLPTTASAELEVRKLRLINEAQPTISGDVKATLTRDGDVWRPRLVVSNASVTIPEASGQTLHDIGIADDVVFIENGKPPPAATAPPPKRTAIIGQRPRRPYLVATLVLQPTRVKSEEISGTVSGQLVASVGEEAIAIDGDITAGRADLELFDRRYRIERAAVRFDGSADPLVDILLTHEFPELTLRVAVTGRLSAPKLQLSSDPPTYAEGELFSFLLGGTPGAEAGSGIRDAATGVASSLVSKKVGDYVTPYLPVDLDVLKFEAATSNSAAAFTAGKWITRKLFLAYRRRVETRPDQNTGELELEYWLGRRVVVDGVIGDRGVHGVDLLWTRRW